MPRDAMKWQQTIPVGATKKGDKTLEDLTQKAFETLRSGLPPGASRIEGKRFVSYRDTMLGKMADLLVVVFFDRPPGPLPERLERLKQFAAIRRQIKLHGGN